jgi:hypothetical protein
MVNGASGLQARVPALLGNGNANIGLLVPALTPNPNHTPNRGLFVEQEAVVV